MKVKLLKLLRQRFKWSYLGSKEQIKRLPDLYWEILDKKRTEPYKIPHLTRLSVEWNYIDIGRMTAAEQLVEEIMGMKFIHEHRKNVFKRKNATFVKQHWG